MSREFWVRLGSLASVVAGITFGLFAAVYLAVSVLQLLDQHSSLGLTLFLVLFAAQRLAPVFIPLVLLALIGMQTRGAQRAGIFGWIGITVAAVGEVIAGVGSILQTVLINSQADSCRTPLNCNFYDPNQYLLLGYMVALLGG